MLGLAGAIFCTLAGAAVGGALKERQHARLRLLESESEMLAQLRIMLIEERMGLGQLLVECAALGGDSLFARRLRYAAKALDQEPLGGLERAYGKASDALPLYAETREDKAAMLHLFRQLGNGTSAMREQAVAAAMRRLKPVVEQARKSAHTGGKLCMQLGVLLGLMLGIALW